MSHLTLEELLLRIQGLEARVLELERTVELLRSSRRDKGEGNGELT